jgi:hypothetical protein
MKKILINVSAGSKRARQSSPRAALRVVPLAKSPLNRKLLKNYATINCKFANENDHINQQPPHHQNKSKPGRWAGLCLGG